MAKDRDKEMNARMLSGVKRRTEARRARQGNNPKMQQGKTADGRHTGVVHAKDR